MANYFLDTSALARHYFLEPGRADVENLLQEPISIHYVSRLTTVEILSVSIKSRANFPVCFFHHELFARKLPRSCRTAFFLMMISSRWSQTGKFALQFLFGEYSHACRERS